MNGYWPTLIAALLLLAATALLTVLHRRHRHQTRQRQRRGIGLLGAMRTLLSDIQKHRGLTTGFHGGDASLLPQIQRLQGQIGGTVAGVQRGGSWVQQNERWQGIAEHWGRLAAGFRHLDQEQNLSQHNRLISNLLYLIEDAAEAHQLHQLGEDIAAVGLIWKELLVTAEYIGQARALGTGVTAAGRCSSVSRIRLNYLRKRIDETTRASWAHIEIAAGVKGKLNELLRCIEEEVLAERPTIAAQSYFRLATDTLDGVFDQFDREVNALQSRL